MRASVDAQKKTDAWTFYDVACPECGARIGKPCVSTIGSLGIGAIGVPIRGAHLKRLPLGSSEITS